MVNAIDLLFPKPRAVRADHGKVAWPREISLAGRAVPPWLARRLEAALRSAGIRRTARARRSIDIALSPEGFARIADPELREQSYELRIHAGGDVALSAPGDAGLRHGIVTLSLLLEASARGARLAPVVIRDVPAFRVRGIMIDMAREYFPPVPYLKTVIDRLADLKVNTLWLYLENHFRAPGLEDISSRKGMTPAQAREVSAYGSARGVDVVPATNLVSHMEGWLRLERYSDMTDGNDRSYPVLTRKEAWPMVKKFVDGLAEAFPSKNFHAGLDEFLRTGTNPEAVRIIKRKGKARYFAEFARKVARYIQGKGKVLWLWDDMVIGKNLFRKEGFLKDAPKALAAIPRDAVLTNWWYWGPKEHRAMIARVSRSGRPFVVAPAGGGMFGNLKERAENQPYMARTGRKHGAFGYVCTHWHAQMGASFEAGWPLLAMSAGQAWSGGVDVDERFLRALSFTITGETDGALGRYLGVLQDIEDGLRFWPVRHAAFVFWRSMSPRLSPAARKKNARLLDQARREHQGIGCRDPLLKKTLAFPITIGKEALAILDAMDRAWAHYHRAAEIERRPSKAGEFRARIDETIRSIQNASAGVGRLARELKDLEATGHTPYEAFALAWHRRELDKVPALIRAAVRDGNGLPYFEKLFYMPDPYTISNLKHIQVADNFPNRFAVQPWPVRWLKAPAPAGQGRQIGAGGRGGRGQGVRSSEFRVQSSEERVPRTEYRV